MNRATLDDVELEYELHGEGEPVMLIHAGIFTDWFTPLLPAHVVGHSSSGTSRCSWLRTLLRSRNRSRSSNQR